VIAAEPGPSVIQDGLYTKSCGWGRVCLLRRVRRAKRRQEVCHAGTRFRHGVRSIAVGSGVSRIAAQSTDASIGTGR
jgi:hypothetical protein